MKTIKRIIYSSSLLLLSATPLYAQQEMNKMWGESQQAKELSVMWGEYYLLSAPHKILSRSVLKNVCPHRFTIFTV